MKKSELKDLIKPIVVECVKESVKEMMLESGLLAAVISEVVKGMGKSTLIENKTKTESLVIEEDDDEDLTQMRKRALQQQRIQPMEKKKIQETKKQLVETVGKSGYAGLNEKFKGVNLFEGINETIPDEVSSAPGSALAGIAPNDPGVSIDGLFDFNRLQANLGGRKK